MPFTQRTIVHAFQNADGTPASGTITLGLSKRMTNSGRTIVPTEVTATLDGNGNLSQVLTCNTDTGTAPGDSEWLVTFRILGMSPEGPYGITVVPGSGSVDLGSLLPAQAYGSA